MYSIARYANILNYLNVEWEVSAFFLCLQCCDSGCNLLLSCCWLVS